MLLPGGIWNEGRLNRDFRFKQVTGGLELALAETVHFEVSHPARVSHALALALEHVGGREANLEQVRELSVADRQYLARLLACHLRREKDWYNATCTSCEAGLDVRLRPSELPWKPAGESFPFVDVDTSQGSLRFRVPTGADQEAVAAIEDETEAVRTLVGRLIVLEKRDSASPDFSAADIEAIESAIEAVAPELVVRVPTQCPECGTQTLLQVDPYACLHAGPQSLLREIHQLASMYHWSEKEILDLPRERRRRYLALLEEARGMLH